MGGGVHGPRGQHCGDLEEGISLKQRLSRKLILGVLLSAGRAQGKRRRGEDTGPAEPCTHRLRQLFCGILQPRLYVLNRAPSFLLSFPLPSEYSRPGSSWQFYSSLQQFSWL